MNKWFDNFLDSFDNGEYHAQYGWIKPWQYKNLMHTAEINKWNMLSQKQLECFLRNIKMKNSSWEDFGEYENDRKKIKIRISNTTGFVSICVIDK